jgi:hypothetical protein
MATITFLTSGVWEYTASAGTGSVIIEAWGSGGKGSSTGNGGSGGAYIYAPIWDLPTGSYVVHVGTGNGDDSWVSASFVGGPGVVVRVSGGQTDGLVTDQSWSCHDTNSYSGSFGGLGGTDAAGYSSYNGAGGGSSGARISATRSPEGAGAGGSSGVVNDLINSRTLTSFYYRNTEAAAGGQIQGGGSGGAGAYYESSIGPRGVIAAQNGSVPGGGGGGSYDYGTNTAGNGASGKVVIVF